jgi:hypothetical protein
MGMNKDFLSAAVNKQLGTKLFEILFFFLKSGIQIQVVLFFIFLNLSHYSYSQSSDSTKVTGNFAGAITVTNNGLSFIPTFSLGKPAAIFDLSIGKKRLSFEPQFRFSLEGQPWSFLFWWRYKLVKANKFRLNIGAHPALSFKSSTVSLNGVSEDVMIARRYLAGEVVPNYFLTKNISLGMYYLYSRGLDKGTTGTTHFVTLNSSFSSIHISNQFYMKFTPQIYYLKMDELDGFYFTSALTLANRKYPLSITGVLNKVIKTRITASKDFVWNISLIYSFNRKYHEL